MPSTHVKAPLLIGRAQELQTLNDWLDGSCRLGTVLGPPGVGKTTLVRAFLASRPPHEGTLSVALSAATSSEQALVLIADKLAYGEVGERPEASVEGIGEALLRRQISELVLDNLEQLLPAFSEAVDHWLAICTDLKILSTSRRELSLPEEQLMELATLPTPPKEERDLERLKKNEACQLFLTRLRVVNPSFQEDDESLALVAEIVRHSQGLPLALELVAARSRLMGLPSLLKRLRSESAADLTHGGQNRSLRSALESSWGLLSKEEQRCMAILSAFAGVFSVDDAEQILSRSGLSFQTSPLDLLQSLRAHSLLAQNSSEALFLYDFVRHFAAAKASELGLSEQARTLHARHFAEVGVQCVRNYDLSGGVAPLRALEAIRAELDAALTNQLARLRFVDSEELGLLWGLIAATALELERLASSQRRKDFLSRLQAHTRWEEIALNCPAPVLYRLANLFCMEHILEPCEWMLSEWKGLAQDTFEHALVEYAKTSLALDKRDFDQALELAAPWLALGGAPATGLICARFFSLCGNVYFWKQDKNKAAIHWEKAHRQMSALQATCFEGVPLSNLCFLKTLQGDIAAAHHYGWRALEIFRGLGDRRSEGVTLGYLAVLALNGGRYAEAREAFSQALAFQRWAGATQQMSFNLSNLARVLIQFQEVDEAANLLAESDALAAQLGETRTIEHNRGVRSELFLARGEIASALAELALAIAELDDAREPGFVFDFSARLGAYASALGNSTLADEAFQRCEGLRARVTDVALQRAATIYMALNPGADWESMAPVFASALRYILSETTPPQTAAEPDWNNSLSVRSALTFVWQRLDVHRRDQICALVLDPEAKALIIDASCRRFRVPGTTEWVDISTRQLLCELLQLLVENHGEQRFVDDERITAHLWPDEIISYDAVTNRIHNAIALLRRQGLRAFLLRDPDRGYHLDFQVTILEVRPPLTLPEP